MKQHNTARVALAATLTLTLCACSSDDNKNAAATTMPAPGTTPTTALTIEGLDGNWTRDCMSIADSSNYSRAQILFADNVGTKTENFFTDNACTDAALPATIVTDLSYQFSDATSITSLGTATHVSTTTESRSVDGNAVTEGINQMSYTIMLITNNTLYFGDTTGSLDGSSEELRPTLLDQVSIFTR